MLWLHHTVLEAVTVYVIRRCPNSKIKLLSLSCNPFKVCTQFVKLVDPSRKNFFRGPGSARPRASWPSVLRVSRLDPGQDRENLLLLQTAASKGHWVNSRTCELGETCKAQKNHNSNRHIKSPKTSTACERTPRKPIYAGPVDSDLVPGNVSTQKKRAPVVFTIYPLSYQSYKINYFPKGGILQVPAESDVT